MKSDSEALGSCKVSQTVAGPARNMNLEEILITSLADHSVPAILPDECCYVQEMVASVSTDVISSDL